jgi:hypothetical protein
MRRLSPRTLLAVVLAGSAIPLAGLFCEDSHIVEYRNATSVVVTVSDGENSTFTIQPGASRKVGEQSFSGARTYTATEPDGRTVYDEQLTWADIEADGWKIVIAENPP